MKISLAAVAAAVLCSPIFASAAPPASAQPDPLTDQCVQEFGITAVETSRDMATPDQRKNRADFMAYLNQFWPGILPTDPVGLDYVFTTNRFQLCGLWLLDAKKPAPQPDPSQPIDTSVILGFKETLLPAGQVATKLGPDGQSWFMRANINSKSIALPKRKTYQPGAYPPVKDDGTPVSYVVSDDRQLYQYKKVTILNSDGSAPLLDVVVNAEHLKELALPQQISQFFEDVQPAADNAQAASPSAADAAPEQPQTAPPAANPPAAAPQGPNYDTCSRPCGNDTVCLANCAAVQ